MRRWYLDKAGFWWSHLNFLLCGCVRISSRKKVELRDNLNVKAFSPWNIGKCIVISANESDINIQDLVCTQQYKSCKSLTQFLTQEVGWGDAQRWNFPNVCVFPFLLPNSLSFPFFLAREAPGFYFISFQEKVTATCMRRVVCASLAQERINEIISTPYLGNRSTLQKNRLTWSLIGALLY